MSVDFSAFHEKLDQNEIDRLNKEYSQNGGGFQGLPSGRYRVVLDKMELRTTNWGTDQISINFKVTDGEKKGRLIFYNGTFNKKVDSGYRATARLISDMTDNELSEREILYKLTQEDHAEVGDYILDLFQALKGAYEYDVDWQVKKQTDINPNTGKPWAPNHFLNVAEDDEGLCIYDL